MPELSEIDREKAEALLVELQVRIDEAAAGGCGAAVSDEAVIARRLDFDERGTPTHRRRLKAQKRESQRRLCPSYKEALPEHGAELHWALATRGYTVENTSLICARCHEGA